MLESQLAQWAESFLPSKCNTLVRKLWLWESQQWPILGMLTGKSSYLSNTKQLCIKPPMIYSWRNTYLLMVGLQYLAQCLVGRKCLINARLFLAWCSTLLYQRNKKSKPDTCCSPAREYSVHNKDKGKIRMH